MKNGVFLFIAMWPTAVLHSYAGFSRNLTFLHQKAVSECNILWNRDCRRSQAFTARRVIDIEGGSLLHRGRPRFRVLSLPPCHMLPPKDLWIQSLGGFFSPSIR